MDGRSATGHALPTGPLSGGKGSVIPCHSLTGETLAHVEAASSGARRSLPSPPMVDTIAVCVGVPDSFRELLASKSGRRLVISSAGDIEVDSPRIGSLPGSYDPNLWVQFTCYDGQPTLRIEGSAHRHIMGHNVYGGPHDVVAAARYMIAVCEAWLGIELPEWSSWRLNRVDLAWVFDLGSELAAFKFIRDQAVAWQTTSASRSLPRSYGTSVYVDRMVLYSKGAEIRKHGKPTWMSNAAYGELLLRACSLVRSEVRYRRRDIERITYSTLKQLDSGLLAGNASQKLSKFGRTTSESMETVRTIETVTSRLNEHYTTARAASLVGTWFKLATIGEVATRAGMSRPTYFRHVAELKAVGVSWSGTNVFVADPAPYGSFVLSAWSPQCVSHVDERITHALARFAA